MISQPMKGLTREQIESNRAEVVSLITELGYEIIDSYVTDETPTGNRALDCLGKSFQIIAQADAVYFMDGWRDSRDCWMEFEACVRYGIKTIAVV
ncbi:MAG: DUF4406 domain-containing protein [Azoarcus sp.]|nr:DUF4406 domain-containing protein [Azoarcus sp.]